MAGLRQSRGWGVGAVTDSVSRHSLAVHPECTQPAISALRSRGGGWSLRPLGSLSMPPSFLLDSDRFCNYHLLRNPEQQVRRDVYLGSKCKARSTKAKSPLDTALPSVIFSPSGPCSAVCVGERGWKDKTDCISIFAQGCFSDVYLTCM